MKTIPKNDEVNIVGLSKDDASEKLFDAGYKSKEIKEYWKAHGKAVKGGIFQATLDWLAETDRTQTELAKFLVDSGSANEVRWFSSRDAIRKLSVKARATKGFEDVAITEAQKAEHKVIVEKASKK